MFSVADVKTTITFAARFTETFFKTTAQTSSVRQKRTKKKRKKWQFKIAVNQNDYTFALHF